MNIPSRSDLQKFSKIGWQSWSTESESNVRYKIPVFNFPPKGEGRLLEGLQTSFKLKKPAYGWCSWYAYGWDIDQNKILDQTKWISKNRQLPLKYILVDGGWCLWGDWLKPDKKRFPKGMKMLAKSIKQFGLSPGLWVSPFLVHPKSNIALKHPDWLVKQNGKFVDGFKLTPWDRFLFYRKWILDIKKKQVRDYIDKVLERLVEVCKYDLLKLDFLYGIYFDPDLSRKDADEFLRSFLKKIKRKYPHVYTISSGCPLIPAAGVVDSMRIGPDSIISPFLKFLPYASKLNKYFHEDVVKAIHKKIWTRKFWNLDPDAFVCSSDTGLSEKQILAFQKVIKQCNGNIFLGDDLTSLSKDRINKFILPLFDFRFT